MIFCFDERARKKNATTSAIGKKGELQNSFFVLAKCFIFMTDESCTLFRGKHGKFRSPSQRKKQHVCVCVIAVMQSQTNNRVKMGIIRIVRSIVNLKLSRKKLMILCQGE